MSLAYDTDWRIRTFYNDRAVNAQGIVPPGLFGYDPEFCNPYKQHNVEKARSLLREAGYPDGVNPQTGERITVDYDFAGSGPDAEQAAEALRKEMEEIGVELNVTINTWPEFLRKMDERRVQVFGGSGWVMDYPDPENFLQLFYGPNESPGSNATNYKNPQYDRLYEQMKSMPNTPERLAIIEKMRAIITEDCPVIFNTHPISFTLEHQWVRNFKPHGITGGYLKYMDLDAGLRQRLRREWNRPNYLPVGVALAVLVGVGVVLAFVRKGDQLAQQEAAA
jgi:ABC-type transport system substrate-binding protein